MVLTIRHNVLMTVDSSILRLLTLLETLILSENLLSVLPDVTGMTTLVYLRLSNNLITTIDIDSFTSLISLETLFLNKNLLNGTLQIR